jgi:DNA-directed RNA polymerase subunit RPC12/RpoP
MTGFGCQACGCPSIEVPREFNDQATIQCRDCGHRLGTWGELKRHALNAVRRAGENSGDRHSSADPLPGD